MNFSVTLHRDSETLWSERSRKVSNEKHREQGNALSARRSAPFWQFEL